MIDINNRSRKELNEYKKSISLTIEQREVLIGGLLGDLSLVKIGIIVDCVQNKKIKNIYFTYIQFLKILYGHNLKSDYKKDYQLVR